MECTGSSDPEQQHAPFQVEAAQGGVDVQVICSTWLGTCLQIPCQSHEEYPTALWNADGALATHCY